MVSPVVESACKPPRPRHLQDLVGGLQSPSLPLEQPLSQEQGNQVLLGMECFESFLLTLEAYAWHLQVRLMDHGKLHL